MQDTEFWNWLLLDTADDKKCFYSCVNVATMIKIEIL